MPSQRIADLEKTIATLNDEVATAERKFSMTGDDNE
jgi:hypothetical protein